MPGPYTMPTRPLSCEMLYASGGSSFGDDCHGDEDVGCGQEDGAYEVGLVCLGLVEYRGTGIDTMVAEHAPREQFRYQSS